MKAAEEIDGAMSSLLREMHAEGHIDNQFEQLLMLQDESEPDFVHSVMELFFQDSQSTLTRIHEMLAGPHPDFTALDQAVHQLKGSASSFGAQRVTSLCIQLRKAVQNQQTDVSMHLLQGITEARQALNERLSMYVQLENQKKALCAS